MENNILSNEEILAIARKNTHLYYRTLKVYHPATYDFINANYNGQNISEKIYKHIYGEQVCLTCHKLLGKRGFKGLLKGYSHFCSDTCASKHPYRLQQINNANIKKYGVKWNGQIPEVKEIIKRNNIKKYGVPHVLQVPSIINKKNNTCISKYETQNYMSTEECKNKIKNTCLKKYGVFSASQVPSIHNKQQKNGFKQIKYKFPSGKIVNVQGYEPFILTKLLRQYSEQNIIVGKSQIPPFWYYTSDGTKHRYFPDIFIKNKNLIVEVKSTWTNKIDKNIKLKEQCVINDGYKFQKFILNRKGEIVNE